jgi:phytoene dehydrogenase-like protein
VLPTIERAGGAVVVSAEVDRILIDGTRAIGVRMTDGREFRANAIVSDAGIRTTMDRLLGAEVPTKAQHVAARTRALPACRHAGAIRIARPQSPLANSQRVPDRAGYRRVWGHALSGAVVTASVMLRRNMFAEVSKAARHGARRNSR